MDAENAADDETNNDDDNEVGSGGSYRITTPSIGRNAVRCRLAAPTVPPSHPSASSRDAPCIVLRTVQIQYSTVQYVIQQSRLFGSGRANSCMLRLTKMTSLCPYLFIQLDWTGLDWTGQRTKAGRVGAAPIFSLDY